VAIGLLASAGCELPHRYWKHDAHRDAYALVPPGAKVVGYDFAGDDSINPFFTATIYWTWPHGSKQQRLAAYRQIALEHGWKPKDGYFTKGSVNMGFLTDVYRPGLDSAGISDSH
jgi:hypothetical protein